MASLQLPKDFDVDTHLNPTYDPWDQRLCLVPDGDLFKAIKRGQASIVTDRIERFTETGIRLQSGAELDADVIVTATGFTVTNFGELVFTVDGVEVDISQTVVYKGLMCSGVPNFVFSGGYTNASFTLKVNLTGDYVMRLLAHMDEIGAQIAMPQAPPDGRTAPLLLLSAGYIDRAAAILPKAGAYEPWALHQNYPRDIKLLRSGPIADEGLEFSTAAGPAV
jgi:cation diffusion facilitator CzcD-associated flavoprotein CzcO